MAFVVRRVSPHDGAALRKVRLAALADAPSAFGSTFAAEAPRPDEEWAARAAAGAEGALRTTFFALDGSEIVGLVGGYRETADAKRVELVSMWTAPSYRRSGAGRALVAAVIDWARDTGAESVSLWVTRGNKPAEDLYASIGFRETGQHQPLPSDPREDELRMEIPIGGADSVGSCD